MNEPKSAVDSQPSASDKAQSGALQLAVDTGPDHLKEEEKKSAGKTSLKDPGRAWILARQATVEDFDETYPARTPGEDEFWATAALDTGLHDSFEIRKAAEDKTTPIQKPDLVDKEDPWGSRAWKRSKAARVKTMRGESTRNTRSVEKKTQHAANTPPSQAGTTRVTRGLEMKNGPAGKEDEDEKHDETDDWGLDLLWNQNQIDEVKKEDEDGKKKEIRRPVDPAVFVGPSAPWTQPSITFKDPQTTSSDSSDSEWDYIDDYTYPLNQTSPPRSRLRGSRPSSVHSEDRPDRRQISPERRPQASPLNNPYAPPSAFPGYYASAYFLSPAYGYAPYPYPHYSQPGYQPTPFLPLSYQPPAPVRASAPVPAPAPPPPPPAPPDPSKLVRLHVERSPSSLGTVGSTHAPMPFGAADLNTLLPPAPSASSSRKSSIDIVSDLTSLLETRSSLTLTPPPDDDEDDEGEQQQEEDLEISRSRENKEVNIRSNNHATSDGEIILRVSVPLHSRFSAHLQKWPERTAQNELGDLCVRKAVDSKRFKRTDGSQSIELLCSQGPKSVDGDKGYQLQWLHIKKHRMNLANFEDLCLNAPNITEELRYIVLKLFKQIQDTHRRRLFDGYLIEPGTVLRCDGSTPKYAKSEHLSATFVCFPYLNLEKQRRSAQRFSPDYPSRSMLQILYPYESTSHQELPPSFCRDAQHKDDGVMHVPQIWAVTIGSKYVITCSQLGSEDILGTSVSVRQDSGPMEQIAQVMEGWLPNVGNPSNDPEDTADGIGEAASGRLFDGKRVEEFLVEEFEDDAGSLEGVAALFNSALSDDAGSLDGLALLFGSALSDDEDSSEIGLSGIPTSIDAPEPPRDIDSDIGDGSQIHSNSAKVIPSTDMNTAADDLDNNNAYDTDSGYTSSELSSSPDNEEPTNEYGVDGPTKLFDGQRIEEFLVEEFEEPERDDDDDDDPNNSHDDDQDTASENTNPAERNDVRRIAKKAFLSWPWLRSDEESKTSIGLIAAESLEKDLRTIMEQIDRSILRQKDLSYADASGASLTDLENAIAGAQSSLQACLAGELLAEKQDSFQDLADDIAIIENEESKAIPKASHKPASGKAKLSIDEHIVQAQKREIYIAIEDLLKTAKDLVHLFVPYYFQHKIANKVWGSLISLSKLVLSAVENKLEHLPPRYVIHPLEDDAIQRLRLYAPTYPIQRCSVCRDGHQYRSLNEAVYHLKMVHFRDDRQSLSVQMIGIFWVRTEQGLRSELLNRRQLRVFQICLGWLRLLHSRAEKIHAEQSRMEANDRGFQLPSDLVECFEAIVLFIIQISTIIFGIQGEIRQLKYIPGVVLDEIELNTVQYALRRLGELGKAAQASMTRAEKTLALSDPETDMVSIGSAGPELLVAVLLQNLRKRNLLSDVESDVNALYQEYLSKLEYQIKQSPRKRRLRDIHALQEELSVVRSVNVWQGKAIDSFIRVLRPDSYNPPTQNRSTLFPSEFECLNRALKDLDLKAAELDALENRTHYLREQLKQSVEILEEDHGKAIFVFTMITTIFLPLSFVTSFFGMNTADIRNTNRSQTFFWAIAIPVTAGIVIAAVMLAYHGDRLYDAFIRMVSQLKGERVVTSPAVPIVEENMHSSMPSRARPQHNRRSSGLSLKRFASEKMRISRNI